MAEKGGFGSLFDLASLVLDIITLGKIKGRDGEVRQVVSPEQLETIKKVLVPKIFGAGPADEALFAAALAKLADRRQMKISRFLDQLTPYDKKQFRLAIAILPEETDRIMVLNMYSELKYDEMLQVAKAIGMISGGKGPLGTMTTETKAAAMAIGKFMSEKLWPFLKLTTNELGIYIEDITDRIEQHNQNPSRFCRIARRLVK